MSIEIAPFDLDLMLTGIENLFAFRARENGLTFSVSKASNVPRFFQGDVHRLRQVLANLLGNAIKFTQHGNVALTVSLREPPSEKAHLRLCVQDSGIGMSESQLAGLFQPFVQADSSISRRFGGTGLGLAISKKLVELMEGQITVESTAGVGSRFYIELALPLAPTPETAQDNSAGKQLHKEILHGKSVLLVEDNKVNQTLAAHLLKKLGMTFEIANHGQEAIDKLHARDFDIVLMDIQMPVMNGLEATELIRREPRYTTLPIIAMSAGVTLDEQERCVEVGMSGFVGKPVHFDELTGKLIEMLSAQA